MKVIFLDFDGVLNCDAYVRWQGRFGVILDPERLKLLKQIVDRTDAKIVLSTSWREHWSVVPGEGDGIGGEINRSFRRFGMEIYDKTPHRGRDRWDNIRLWLAEYPGVSAYVVLDDLVPRSREWKGHYIRTFHSRGGMDGETVREAIALLGKEEVP